MACLFARVLLPGDDGLLVHGGLDGDEQVLATARVFKTQSRRAEVRHPDAITSYTPQTTTFAAPKRYSAKAALISSPRSPVGMVKSSLVEPSSVKRETKPSSPTSMSYRLQKTCHEVRESRTRAAKREFLVGKSLATIASH